MKRVFLLCFAVFLVTGQLYAADQNVTGESPSAEAPVLTVGDTWTIDGWRFESPVTSTFIGEEDGLLVFDVGNGKKRYKSKDHNLVKDVKNGKVKNTRIPDMGFLRFPLFIGKSWTHPYQNDDIPRTANYRVTAYEKVTVRAGTFDVFRIEGLDKRDDKNYGIVVTIWYAPSVKTVVKLKGEDQYSHDTVKGWKWELVSFGLKKP